MLVIAIVIDLIYLIPFLYAHFEYSHSLFTWNHAWLGSEEMSEATIQNPTGNFKLLEFKW